MWTVKAAARGVSPERSRRLAYEHTNSPRRTLELLANAISSTLISYDYSKITLWFNFLME